MIEKMHIDNSANNRSQGTLRAPAAQRSPGEIDTDPCALPRIQRPIAGA